MAERAIAALGGPTSIIVTSPKPDVGRPAITPNPQARIERPHYSPGDKVATRVAYGDALVALSARPEVIVLDAEVGNSTHSEAFEKVAPDRYFEAFISEQLMVGAACGLAVRHYAPFAATFGAFFSRAYDFIRMAGISEVAIHLSGSHSGVEIGSDGPSQMALEDLAEMRAVNDSTVLYPSDAPSTVALVLQTADRPGVSYVRTTRGAYPVLYSENEEFPIGGAKVLRSGPADVVTLVGAGVTVHESLTASDLLAAEGIAVRVIDCYSVKPIDQATLVGACQATAGRIIVTEDHYPAGGLGEAVLSALIDARVNPRFTHLAVAGLSQSGTPAEFLDAAGISADHIAKAARALLGD